MSHISHVLARKMLSIAGLHFRLLPKKKDHKCFSRWFEWYTHFIRNLISKIFDASPCVPAYTLVTTKERYKTFLSATPSRRDAHNIFFLVVSQAQKTIPTIKHDVQKTKHVTSSHISSIALWKKKTTTPTTLPHAIAMTWRPLVILSGAWPGPSPCAGRGAGR